MKQLPSHFSEIDTSKLDAVVIGIHGFAESGKDTAGNHLIKLLGTHYHDSFARPLREAYTALFGRALGFTYDDVVKAEFKRQTNPLTGRTHRKELQLLGTEFYRDGTGNADIWIQNLYLRNVDCRDFLVLTDVRFPNEAAFVRQNGILVHVNRPGHQIPGESHASEQKLAEVPGDVILNNDGTLLDFYSKINQFFSNRLLLEGLLQWEDIRESLEETQSTSFLMYKDALLERGQVLQF